MSGWKPIATAPRDGAKVLGFWFGNDIPIISVIWWRGGKYPDHPWRNAKDDSTTRGYGQCHLPAAQQTWRQGPTHWWDFGDGKPMPDAPEVTP